MSMRMRPETRGRSTGEGRGCLSVSSSVYCMDRVAQAFSEPGKGQFGQSIGRKQENMAAHRPSKIPKGLYEAGCQRCISFKGHMDYDREYGLWNTWCEIHAKSQQARGPSDPEWTLQEREWSKTDSGCWLRRQSQLMAGQETCQRMLQGLS